MSSEVVAAVVYWSVLVEAVCRDRGQLYCYCSADPYRPGYCGFCRSYSDTWEWRIERMGNPWYASSVRK